MALFISTKAFFRPNSTTKNGYENFSTSVLFSSCFIFYFARCLICRGCALRRSLDSRNLWFHICVVFRLLKFKMELCAWGKDISSRCNFITAIPINQFLNVNKKTKANKVFVYIQNLCLPSRFLCFLFLGRLFVFFEETRKQEENNKKTREKNK